MYYSSANFKVNVFDTTNIDGIDYRTPAIWNITVYCKARRLQAGGIVADFENIIQFINDKFNNKQSLKELFGEDYTEELIAKWLYDQIVPCYKIKISTSAYKTFIYEEDD